jgi:hypothetical protein
MKTPVAVRPQMQGYGIAETADGLLAWSWAVERLTKARNYWIGSTRADGRPHVAPVWGLWLADGLYFGSNPTSQKGRNLARNPEVVMHLESGDEVVIVEGRITRLDPTQATVFQPIAASYKTKYDVVLGDMPEAEATHYLLQPRVALGWLETDYPRTATKWQFTTT